QWITYLLGLATDDLRAKCLVVTDYNDADSTFIDRILTAPAILTVKRITIVAHARSENSYGADQIARLVDLATDCGELRRIDIQLSRDHFAQFLTRWIQTLVGHEKVTKLVNNVVFHCEYDVELSHVLSEPVARLPKRKWQTTNVDGSPCEMEDIEEKSVFAFRNKNTAKEITAVFGRYSYFRIHPQTSIACDFIFDRGEDVDILDFSRKNIRSAGIRCWERMTDFD
ncbi:hypothetical protein AAVH_22712, partial [Aphelenchoides avenae]